MSLHNANILLSIMAYLSANGLKTAEHFQNHGLVDDTEQQLWRQLKHSFSDPTNLSFVYRETAELNVFVEQVWGELF